MKIGEKIAKQNQEKNLGKNTPFLLDETSIQYKHRKRSFFSEEEGIQNSKKGKWY